MQDMDLFNTKGFVCSEGQYSDEDELYNKRKWVVFFVYLNSELIYISSGAQDRPQSVKNGNSSVKEFNKMYKNGTSSLLDVIVVKSFSNQDMSKFYEAFCVKKFSPKINTMIINPEDKIITKQERFVDHYKYVEVQQSDLRVKVGLLCNLGYSNNYISDILSINISDVNDIRTKSSEHRNIVQPFEYIDISNEIVVDSHLFKLSCMLHKDLVEYAEKNYTVKYW